MRKQLEPGVYTQINTDSTTYLFQNLSNYNIKIVVSDTQPSTNADNDFEIKHLEGFSGDNITGICWGKPISKSACNVGLIEG